MPESSFRPVAVHFNPSPKKNSSRRSDFEDSNNFNDSLKISEQPADHGSQQAEPLQSVFIAG
jgi:hypothetical protein